MTVPLATRRPFTTHLPRLQTCQMHENASVAAQDSLASADKSKTRSSDSGRAFDFENPTNSLQPPIQRAAKPQAGSSYSTGTHRRSVQTWPSQLASIIQFSFHPWWYCNRLVDTTPWCPMMFSHLFSFTG